MHKSPARKILQMKEEVRRKKEEGITNKNFSSEFRASVKKKMFFEVA
jgi:hypothetical protein